MDDCLSVVDSNTILACSESFRIGCDCLWLYTGVISITGREWS